MKPLTEQQIIGILFEYSADLYINIKKGVTIDSKIFEDVASKLLALQGEPTKEAEEFIRNKYDVRDNEWTSKPDCWWTYKDLVNLLEEYASLSLPTDEEIKKECDKQFVGNVAPTYFTMGAKWMREQMKLNP